MITAHYPIPQGSNPKSINLVPLECLWKEFIQEYREAPDPVERRLTRNGLSSVVEEIRIRV